MYSCIGTYLSFPPIDADRSCGLGGHSFFCYRWGPASGSWLWGCSLGTASAKARLVLGAIVRRLLQGLWDLVVGDGALDVPPWARTWREGLSSWAVWANVPVGTDGVRNDGRCSKTAPRSLGPILMGLRHRMYLWGAAGFRELVPPAASPDIHLSWGSQGGGSSGHRCRDGWLQMSAFSSGRERIYQYNLDHQISLRALYFLFIFAK